MRRATCIVGFALVICLVLPGSAFGGPQVKLINTCTESYFVKSEQAIASFSDLSWTPQLPGSKKDFQEDPVRVSVNQTLHRAVGWRLDAGNAMDFDWVKVRARLQHKYKVNIGEVLACTVAQTVLPQECYCVGGFVYAAYTRDIYEVREHGKSATFSVLMPADGMAIVYEVCTLLPYSSCSGCPAPQSALGTCASANGLPFPDDTCQPNQSGDKRNFQEDPALSNPAAQTSTWGLIKALYGDD